LTLKGQTIMLEDNASEYSLLETGTDRLARFAHLAAVPTEYE
jgi:hypothetical protein